MKILLLSIVILLASCSSLDECTYTESGANESFCLSHISGRPLMPRQAPLYNVDDYEIDYVKYSTFSAVAKECKSLTGKPVRSCVDINYTRMTAVIHSIYSDNKAVKHELPHLTHPYDWETTYIPDRPINWN